MKTYFRAHHGRCFVVSVRGAEFNFQAQGWANRSLDLEALFQQRDRLQEAVGLLYEE